MKTALDWAALVTAVAIIVIFALMLGLSCSGGCPNNRHRERMDAQRAHVRNVVGRPGGEGMAATNRADLSQLSGSEAPHRPRPCGPLRRKQAALS